MATLIDKTRVTHRKMIGACIAAVLVVALQGLCMAQQASQSPSPMADSTRPHTRIAQQQVPGKRVELQALKGAVLFIGPDVRKGRKVPLIVHFHGAPWLVEYHIAHDLKRAALITVQLGSGSSVYNRPFDRTDAFRAILDEAKGAIGQGTDWSSITLSAWSAGYGAIRAILRDDTNFSRVDNVLLLDGIHASYSPEGKPLADGGVVNAQDLDSFEHFAREAVAGKKVFVITHSEIFPATYASTTECTDYLLKALSIKRKPILKAGPNGMQQLSGADNGNFHVRGYAGNTAPDHVDQIHSMPDWFKLLKIH